VNGYSASKIPKRTLHVIFYIISETAEAPDFSGNKMLRHRRKNNLRGCLSECQTEIPAYLIPWSGRQRKRYFFSEQLPWVPFPGSSNLQGIPSSAGSSLVYFQMDVEPFLPSKSFLRFLFLSRTIIITSGSLHGLALRFLFLFHSLVIITFGLFRGCFPFVATGTPLQSCVVGVGCMNCIPFLEKLVDL
jgi:hypothetical protein